MSKGILIMSNLMHGGQSSRTRKEELSNCPYQERKNNALITICVIYSLLTKKKKFT